MATRKKHSPEEIVRKLRDADSLISEGLATGEVCRQLEISEATYYKWRKQYQGMSLDDVKELRDLRAENAQLKRLVADAGLEKLALKENSAKQQAARATPKQSMTVPLSLAAYRHRSCARPKGKQRKNLPMTLLRRSRSALAT